ncbi:MAG: hypothetical protein Q8M94_06570, partial [Ignavibacteria bacterium]|nr:hypothetical protein [Ignavibacteria bacterium]
MLKLIKTATDKELNARLDEIIQKSGGLFGKDTRTEDEKAEQKEIVAELDKRKPEEEEEDSGDIEFLMSSREIGKATRAQQPKHAYIKDWFEQTLSSDYRGT